MLRSMKMAALAAGLIIAVASVARAEDPATADDTARFLAGLAPSEGSPLTPLTRDPAWQHHARFLDGAFAQLEQRQLARVRAWADTNLAAPKPTMFYFFSGPDFVYADAFYGKASTYVMAALEPPGSMPDITRLPRGSIDSALGNIEHSLGTILNFSFFITKHMKVDLHVGQISGTLPLLFVFMERSGKSIRQVTPVTLDEEGQVHAGSEAARPNAPRGVRILFSGKDGGEKTLYYFSTDLSNSGVKSSGFLKFCAGLAPGNSLLKSASYLLHSGSFTTTRDFLLANSATIIQDDSGIPLADYNSRKWRFFPFGRYAGPISEFPGRYQQSYAELFRRAQPIDFGIGYRWRTYESNVLLAVRLGPDEPPPADATASTDAPPPPRPHPRRPKPPPPEPRRGFFWFR
ncbi:MAG TPA: hypothetical protein VKR55_11030 [Bradyrhizobium sp.]|uniref:hypothetical protein n=1 Tax=Bradyrhizobium sp. TaxID=376 RepID=UPI002C43C21C|nr:hypothetical protein [Bradyrhizobium sp.]HLZ02670.1 hypothetical protein [Bradyrhizobium sp.]